MRSDVSSDRGLKPQSQLDATIIHALKSMAIDLTFGEAIHSDRSGSAKSPKILHWASAINK